MKKIPYYILIPAAIFLLGYFTIAFITLKANPALWPVEARAFYAIGGVFISTLITAAFYDLNITAK